MTPGYIKTVVVFWVVAVALTVLVGCSPVNKDKVVRDYESGAAYIVNCDYTGFWGDVIEESCSVVEVSP